MYMFYLCKCFIMGSWKPWAIWISQYSV